MRPTLFPPLSEGGAGKVAVDEVPELQPELVDALQHHSVAELFPVQAAVVPVGHPSLQPVRTSRGPTCPPKAILRARASLGRHPGDVCVSAPTGSGKTLAYVLPIVSRLLGRLLRLPRALVVLPNRDLVQQVRGVFEGYLAAAVRARGRSSTAVPDLAVVALGVGGATFAREQRLLVRPSAEGGTEQLASGTPACRHPARR